MRDAIVAGKLRDLSARGVARHLGLTTSVFYHYFGSFELFLYAVSISGLSLMADDMQRLARGRNPLLAIATHYIELALTRPLLFELMTQYAYPWREIRRKKLLDTTEGLRAWNTLAAALRDAGSTDPIEDTRLFHATLHGIATLTQSGRMNIEDLAHTDREVAHRTARRLVRVFGAWLSRRRRSS